MFYTWPCRDLAFDLERDRTIAQMLHSRCTFVMFPMCGRTVRSIDITYPIEKKGGKNTRILVSFTPVSINLCHVFSFLSFPPPPFSLSISRVSRKITSTCNSATTCNASLARYRKRHSRPLVTTALKRHSIFRRCMSSVLYAPRRLNPRGDSCLSSSSPPLLRTITRCAQVRLRASVFFLYCYPTLLTLSSRLPFSTDQFYLYLSRVQLQSFQIPSQ